MGCRLVEFLVKRFPSRISSTTHLPPVQLGCAQRETLVSLGHGNCDTASLGGGGFGKRQEPK